MDIKKYYYKIRSIIGLSVSLAKVKFKVRNEGSYLGIFWYLLNPLAMFSIFLFLGKLINKTTAEHYPVYLLLGLIMFNLFRSATDASTSSITSNAGIIKSLKINLEPFVISGVMQSVFSHLFEVIILILFLIYFKISLFGLLFYPLILLFLTMFIVGFSFILATVGTYINDIANVWSIVVNITWFAAPVYYVVSKGSVPLLNKVNPMFYFIENAREIVIYNKTPDLNMMLIMIACSIFFLLFGVFVFEKYKSKFSEII